MTPTTATKPAEGQEQAFDDADYADPRLRLDQVNGKDVAATPTTSSSTAASRSARRSTSPTCRRSAAS
jgi:hypothetical protein